MIFQGLLRRTATILGILCLGACASGFKATYDSDPTQDFTGYRTYTWVSEHPMIVGPTDRMVNPLLEPRIMAAIESELTAKGLDKATANQQADFALSFTIGSREEVKVSSYPSTYVGGYSYGRPGWGGSYYGMGMGTETSVRQYQQGMLAVDVFDVAAKRPVWHGVATKSITSSDREEIDATVAAAVAAVLKNFPPR